jgi:hypothetical protein
MQEKPVPRVIYRGLWFKALVVLGGAVFLISSAWDDGRVKIVSPVPLLALGIFMLGATAWKKSEAEIPDSPEAGVRARSSWMDGITILLFLTGIIFLAAGLIRTVASASSVPSFPAPTGIRTAFASAKPTETSTPSPARPTPTGISLPTVNCPGNKCRIAMFTIDGEVWRRNERLDGSAYFLLDSLGYEIDVFPQDELEDISASFVAQHDAVLLTTLDDRWDLSRLIESGLPVLTMTPGFADDLGLGSGQSAVSGAASVFNVWDAGHPITTGLPGERLNFATPVAINTIDGNRADVDILVAHEASDQAVLAVRKSKPYVWFGWHQLSDTSDADIPSFLFQRAVIWMCGYPSSKVTPEPTPSPTLMESTSSEIPAVTATPVRNHIPGKVFSDSVCGITFEYPTNWTVEKTTSAIIDEKDCLFGLKPDNYGQIAAQADHCMEPDAVYVWTMNLKLEDAARARHFVYEGGLWYTESLDYGGLRLSAQLVRAGGLYILRGRFVMAKGDKGCVSGPTYVLADKAVVNAGKNRSMALLDDSIAFNAHFEYILQTVAFLE